MKGLPEATPQDDAGKGLAEAMNDLSEKILLADMLNKADDEEVDALVVSFEKIRLLQERMTGGQNGFRDEVLGMIKQLYVQLDAILKRQRT